MRLSAWRAAAPAREAVTAKVIGVVEPVLATLGAEKDPECWVAWGDEPAARWTLLVPTAAGLVTVSVRVNIPMEGPRAGGKLVRWSRVQLGELTAELQAGHHFASASLEGVILRGVDDDAGRIGAFLQVVFAAMDGRPMPRRVSPAPRSRRAGAARAAE